MGRAPLRKHSKLTPNSMAILHKLDRKCPGCERHANMLWDGNTNRAATYPVELCKAVCRGLRTQLELDHYNMVSVLVVGCAKEASIDSLWGREESGKQFGDDIRGRVLNPEAVVEARREEIEKAMKMNVWARCPRRRRTRPRGEHLSDRDGLMWTRAAVFDHDSPPRRSSATRAMQCSRPRPRSNASSSC